MKHSQEYYNEFIGKKFNRFTIIEFCGRVNKKIIAKAKCDCGNIHELPFTYIKNSHIKSCGCLNKDNIKKRQHDFVSKYIGVKINKLTITEYLETKKRKTKVKAICECGNKGEYLLSSLINENTKSCGCFHKEMIKKSLSTHNLCSHPLYSTWAHMIQRCTNENNNEYKYYGGRGVKVSMRWEHDFEAFYEWAIKRWQPGLELDKDKLASQQTGVLYCPELCCFLSTKENTRNKSNNRMIEYNGETKCLAEWCEILNMSRSVLWGRLNRGWNIEKAFRTPVNNYK